VTITVVAVGHADPPGRPEVELGICVINHRVPTFPELVKHGRRNFGQLFGAVDDRGAELGHEVRAALMGMEAAATALSRNRELLTAEQFEDLSTGLVAEIQRLRALLDGRFHAPAGFDLHDAIAPVLTCARAEGVDVRSTVPRGMVVEGMADSTAQVVRALLTNAKRHAPGSSVDVRALALDDDVVVYVEDRGPGVSISLQERVFERRMRSLRSDGSGLGLFIARGLMKEQNGSIAVEPRLGGGSSFVLRFRRHPAGQADLATTTVAAALTRVAS
jgi:signal transduction histidine kinase